MKKLEKLCILLIFICKVICENQTDKVETANFENITLETKYV